MLASKPAAIEFQSSPTLEGWALATHLQAILDAARFQSSPTLEGWALIKISLFPFDADVSILAHP